MASLIYDSALYDAMVGNIDFDDDAFAVMLVGAGYAPDKAAHRKRSAITGEVAGAGYDAGGKVVAVAAAQAADRVDLTLGGALWGPSTITARGAVYYKSRGGAAAADELVAFIDFASDVISTNGNFILDVSQLRILNGDEEVDAPMIISVTGPDGGRALAEQTASGPGAKEMVIALAGYMNAGATPQTISVPVDFMYPPIIWPNSSPPCEATETTITLPALMVAPVDAVIVIKGF